MGITRRTLEKRKEQGTVSSLPTLHSCAEKPKVKVEEKKQSRAERERLMRLAEIRRVNKEQCKKVPQITILTDFFRYGAFTIEEFRNYRNQLLRATTDNERNVIMRTIRDSL